NERQGLVGNIYKGKVTRVLPGMQAAFVEIGLEKAGFLHVSDFHTDVEGFGSAAEDIGEEDVETEPLHDSGSVGPSDGQYSQDSQDSQDSDDSLESAGADDPLAEGEDGAAA